jgi:GDP-L-fucose synthase
MKGNSNGESMIDWATTRVLLTGGAGFLGSRVADLLRRRGARDVFIPRSKQFDLVDGAAVRRLMRDVAPDMVLHLAARMGGIAASRSRPSSFFYDNAMMGLQVLHEAHRHGVAKVVALSTVCAYPRECPLPFREEDLWNGLPESTHAAYGIAKRILSIQAEAYRAEHGMNVIVVCPTNLYGPGDNFDRESGHVVPAMLLELERARRSRTDRVAFWGDGTPTRDFLYVDDCALGIVLAAERFDEPGPINLATGTGIRMDELSQRIAALVGYRGKIVWDTSKPNGDARRVIDVRRARELLGFQATTSLDEGLARTYEWMLRNVPIDS